MFERTADDLWKTLLSCFYCGQFAPDCPCCKACGKRQCADPMCEKELDGAFNDNPADEPMYEAED